MTCKNCKKSIGPGEKFVNKGGIYCIPCFESVFRHNCQICKLKIGCDSKEWSVNGKYYHEACFKCVDCQTTLNGKKLHTKEGKLYCIRCYNENFSPKCYGCQEIISVEVTTQNFEGKSWHVHCFACTGCRKKLEQVFTKMDGGRLKLYCGVCYDKAYGKKCDICHKLIKGKYCTYKSQDMHYECYKCSICSKGIFNQTNFLQDEKLVCSSCFESKFAQICTKCKKPITGKSTSTSQGAHYHTECFKCVYCNESLSTFYNASGGGICCSKCLQEERNYKILADIVNPQWPIMEFRTKWNVRLLSASDSDYANLKKYAEGSNCHYPKFNLLKLFEISQCEHPKITSQSKNRMLLWHGTRRGNLEGILKRHFVIPPKSNSRPGMFGNGIYFADRASKSAQYCGKDRPGYLLLCEVDMGSWCQKTKAVNDLSEPPKGYDSVFGAGKYQPKASETLTQRDGVRVPLGVTVLNEYFKGSDLNYNEYIVYDTSRIQIRYLIEADF